MSSIDQLKSLLYWCWIMLSLLDVQSLFGSSFLNIDRDRSKMKLIMTDKKLVKDSSFVSHIINLNGLDFETSSLFYSVYSLNDRLKLIRCLTAILSLIR